MRRQVQLHVLKKTTLPYSRTNTAVPRERRPTTAPTTVCQVAVPSPGPGVTRRTRQSAWTFATSRCVQTLRLPVPPQHRLLQHLRSRLNVTYNLLRCLLTCDNVTAYWRMCFSVACHQLQLLLSSLVFSYFARLFSAFSGIDRTRLGPLLFQRVIVHLVSACVF